MISDQFDIEWVDKGYSAKLKPNPKYPNGRAIDVSEPGHVHCTTAVPYPAPRCGTYLLKCKVCGFTAMLSTAGRIDDPVSVKFNCMKGRMR